MLSFTTITNANEIDVLHGKESTFANLHYTYDSETINMLKQNLDRPDSFYSIVKDEDAFVAFCSTDNDWWEPNFFFLREIFVMPSHQGQQIGERLMRESIDHARKRNATGVVTETAFENIPMQKLCEKCGFKKWDNPEWKEGITYKKLL